MATQKTSFIHDHDYDAPLENPAPRVLGMPRNKMLRVKLASGKIVEVKRPKIIRTRRLDGLTLNRDVVRALGRLEARNRDIGKIKAHQLELDLKK